MSENETTNGGWHTRCGQHADDCKCEGPDAPQPVYAAGLSEATVKELQRRIEELRAVAREYRRLADIEETRNERYWALIDVVKISEETATAIESDLTRDAQSDKQGGVWLTEEEALVLLNDSGNPSQRCTNNFVRRFQCSCPACKVWRDMKAKTLSSVYVKLKAVAPDAEPAVWSPTIAEAEAALAGEKEGASE